MVCSVGNGSFDMPIEKGYFGTTLVITPCMMIGKDAGELFFDIYTYAVSEFDTKNVIIVRCQPSASTQNFFICSECEEEWTLLGRLH